MPDEGKIALEQGEPLLEHHDQSDDDEFPPFQYQPTRPRNPIWQKITKITHLSPTLLLPLGLLIPALILTRMFAQNQLADLHFPWSPKLYDPNFIETHPFLYVKTSIKTTNVSIGQEAFFTLTVDAWRNRKEELVWDGVETEPSFVAQVESVADRRERISIVGTRVSKGRWRFPFTVFTPGKFIISPISESEVPFYNSNEHIWRLFQENEKKVKEAKQRAENDHVDIYDSPGDMSTLSRFEVEVAEPDSKDIHPLRRHLESLPVCGLDVPSMQGRWVSVEYLKSLGVDHPALPKNSTKWDTIHIPDHCYVPWRETEEVQKCLKGKHIGNLGDSVLLERALDLGLALTNTEKYTEDLNVTGKTQVCGDLHSHPRHFYWPVPEHNSSIGFIWNGHWNSCDNGLGAMIFEMIGVKRRLRQSMLQPTTIRDLPENAQVTSEDIDAVPDPPYQDLPTDVALVNTGLHDIIQMGERNTSLATYEEWLNVMLESVAKLSKHRILLLTTSKMPKGNYMVRLMNEMHVRVGKKHGYHILDIHSPQFTRVNGWLGQMWGDWHHSSLLVNIWHPTVGGLTNYGLRSDTQALINMICQLDEPEK